MLKEKDKKIKRWKIMMVRSRDLLWERRGGCA
jgi:hypothetical protein